MTGIVIGFMNDFVIEKEFGNISLTGARPACGRAAGGVGLAGCVFF